MARKKSSRKGFGKKAYSFIVDGETEIWYLQMMKKNEKLPKIDIKPELPKKKKIKDQYKLIKENSKDYDQVIWIIDLDTIIKEDRERRPGSKLKLQELKEYSSKLDKIKNVTVLVNTPCLEFWLYLHTQNSGRYFRECAPISTLLNKSELLKGYEKTEKFFKDGKEDIYQKIKSEQSKAVNTAEKLGDFDFNNSESAKAEIYQIFELLKIKL